MPAFGDVLVVFFLHIAKARQISLSGFSAALSKLKVNWVPGDDLLSHGESPHYHRRCIVSLPSSGWDRVVPILYGHQANSFEFPVTGY